MILSVSGPRQKIWFPGKPYLSQIPQIKIHSFAFHNNKDLTFSDVSGLGHDDALIF